MARKALSGVTCVAVLTCAGATLSCASGSIDSDSEVAAKGETIEVCAEDPLEPNDTRRSAAEIPFGGAAIEGSLCFRYAQDWYTFQGPPVGAIFSVRVDLPPQPTARRVSATLFDEAGNQVQSDTGAAVLLTATSNGGRYYVRLYWEDAVATTTYRLQTALGTLPRCDQPDPQEPNNDSATATPLALGQSLSGYICGYDSDYFHIAAPPVGTEFTVNVYYDAAVSPLQTRLYRSGYASVPPVTSSSTSNNESYVVTSTGEYYELRAYSNNGVSNAYRVEVVPGYAPAPSCAAEDSFEPNDRVTQATELGLGASASAFLCESLPDVFAVQGPPAGTLLTASVAFDGPVNADLELMKASATATTNVATGSIRVPLESTDPATHVLSTVSDGGRYLLRLTGELPTARPYTVGFATTPSACADNESGEPNDELSAVSAVPFPGSFAGDACANRDVFRFQGPPSKTRFEVEVLFRELPPGGTRVSLYDTRGRLISSEIATFGRSLLQGLSNGGRYYLAIEPLTGGNARYEVTLRETVRSCSVEAEISSLGAACGISNVGPSVGVNAGGAVTAPELAADTSYLVTLNASGVGNGGSVAFTASRTGSYAFFVGSPGVRFEVRDASGGELAPACFSGLDSSECNKLRRVYRYELVAGERYLVTLGPTSPQQFVRLLIAETTVSAIVCTNPELPDRARICDLNLPATSVSAAALGSDGPALPKEQMTLVQLAPTANGFGGSVTFVPEVSGRYRIYLSSQLKADVVAGAEAVALSCSRDMTERECESFRKGFAVRLRADVPVRLDLDGSAVDSTRVFLTGAELQPEVACGDGELPDVAATCSTAWPTALTLDAAPLSAEAGPNLPAEITTSIRLATSATANGGVVNITPQTSGSYQLYLSAPHLPFRLYDELEQLSATCTQPLSAGECVDFRRGSRFELIANRTYRLELGPVTPLKWVRVRLDSSND